MTYQVVYADTFIQDINEHVAYLRGQHVSAETIEAWYAKLFERLDSLDLWPRTYPVDESYTAEVGRESHKYIYGKYLVMYQVDDTRRRVELVAFLHGSTRKEA